MAEFVPPSMPQPPPGTVPSDQGGEREPSSAAGRTASRAPGALGRLISLVVTIGLAWAMTVALTAWLLGLFLTRG